MTPIPVRWSRQTSAGKARMPDRFGRRVLVAGVAAVLALLIEAPAASAFGYDDTGYDPNDRAKGTNCCYIDPDFRSSTRKVWVDPHGRAWFTLTFRTYDWLTGGPYEAIVKLDSRGGPLAEFRMHFFDSGGGPPIFCSLTSVASGRHRRGVLTGPQFGSEGSGKRASCRVRLSWLKPNKRVSWTLYSPPVLGKDEDYAPGRGSWYV